MQGHLHSRETAVVFGGRTPREDGTAAASEWEGRGPLLDILVLLFFEKIIPSLWP